MNITLKTFQKTRVRELIETAAVAQANWQHYNRKQIISFTAPTGSGKTIMMANFIESMLCGDDEGMVAAAPETIFIWLSDSPELNEQSLKKLIKYCNNLVIDQFKTLDESFRGEKLEQNKIYFLNTQKLSKTSKMTSTGDGRDWTIWETIENTIEEYGQHLVLIIDEAHRGAKTNQTTTMQKFVNGSEKDGIQALPVIIGMSATPERFNALAGASTSTLSKVIVTPKEVRESGLLKDTIEIHYPEESVINKNIAVLQAAADEWKDKCLHWYNYTEKQHYQNVCPIFVIQVEAGSTGKVSATNLDECLQVVEKRTGEKFEAGDVVHAFGNEKNMLIINGLEVPYCEPSVINDDRKIKVVLFKEALATGWDCPRAEAMMSYRVARDATYISQLLGRMIRTPLRMRVEVDESLNYVHLYLPYFDSSTVEEVIKKLTEEEGGTIPADVHAVQGGKKTTVSLTTKRPVTHTIVVHENSQSSVTLPSNTNQNDNPTTSQENTVTQAATSNVQNNTEDTHSQCDENVQQEGTNTPEAETPHDEGTMSSGSTTTEKAETSTPMVDPYDKVKNAINQAEILTYEVKTATVTRNYLRALFDMARLVGISEMDTNYESLEKVKKDIAKQINNYIQTLKCNGEYKPLVDKALEFQLNTLSVQLYKNDNTYDSQQGPDLYSKTDAGLNHQYQQADTLLCGEKVGNIYDMLYCNEDDENSYMYDVILYVADQHQYDLLMNYAKSEFLHLADKFRSKTKNIAEKYRIQYNKLVSDSSTVSEHLFHLPETINVDLDLEGETCTDHLFVNEEGTATFKLKGWEPTTLAEERKHPQYECWLRNQDRKPWALCIPYKYGNEIHRMYPDFFIVRKDDNGEYEYSILEPHRDDKKDNLPKAKALADYAQKCNSVSRIQMLRKITTPSGDRMLRLEFCKTSVRNKVQNCITEADFDCVFNSEGEFDI